MKHPIDFFEMLSKKHGIAAYNIVVYRPYDDDGYNKFFFDDVGRGSASLSSIRRKIESPLSQGPLYGQSEHTELAVCSDVTINNDTQMILAVDLASHAILRDAIRIAKTLNDGDWFVFNTGASYHVYWDNVVTEKTWKKFMKNAQYYKEIDQMWIKMSLKRGFGATRVSSNVKKKIVLVASSQNE